MLSAMEKIDKYRRIHAGKNPSPEWLSVAGKIGIEQAREMLRVKSDDGKTFQDKPKNNRPTKEIESQVVGTSLHGNNQATIHLPIVLPPKTLREKVQAVLVASLPIIFFTAAAVGSYRSFTLCYSFFARFNTADGAFTMSVLLVALAFGMPQATHILWPQVRQGKRILVFSMAVILSIASIGTNVIITAQELQNQKADSRTALTADQELRTKLSARIAELEGQRKDRQEALELDKQERSILMEAQKGLVVGDYQYNRVRINLDQIKKRIDTGIADIDGINRQIADAMATMPTVGADATQAGEVDTVVNWMGSIIIEIGGPVALALSLCL